MDGQDRRTKRLVLAAMCFGMFLIQLDLTIVNAALPKISAAMGGSVADLQWVVDGYALVFASLLLTGGSLGDLYGRKRLFLIGLGIFALGSALCGLAPSVGMLVLGRVIQGIGAAIQLPGSLSIISVVFTDARERARAIGLWASISGLALIVEPVLGGALVDSAGWPSVFFINLPVAALALALTAWAVRESSSPEGRRLDLPGQMLSILFLGSAVYAVIEGNERGWSSPAIVAAVALALVSGAVFVVVERRAASPLLHIGFFGDGTFAAANVVALLVVFGIYGMLFVITLFFQNVEGLSAIEAGARLLPVTGTFVGATIAGGRLAARLGTRLPMAAGMAAGGGGLLLLATVSPQTPYLTVATILALIGTGVGLVFPSMVAAAMGAVPPSRAGMASGVINTSRQAGGAIGVAVLGSLLSGGAQRHLAAALSGLGIDAPVRARLLQLAAHGGPVDRTLLGGRSDPRLLQQLVDASFASGMHLALLVGGSALLLGALAASLSAIPLRAGRMGAARMLRGVEPKRTD